MTGNEHSYMYSMCLLLSQDRCSHCMLHRFTSKAPEVKSPERMSVHSSLTWQRTQLQLALPHSWKICLLAYLEFHCPERHPRSAQSCRTMDSLRMQGCESIAGHSFWLLTSEASVIEEHHVLMQSRLALLYSSEVIYFRHNKSNLPCCIVNSQLKAVCSCKIKQTFLPVVEDIVLWVCCELLIEQFDAANASAIEAICHRKCGRDTVIRAQNSDLAYEAILLCLCCKPLCHLAPTCAFGRPRFKCSKFREASRSVSKEGSSAVVKMAWSGNPCMWKSYLQTLEEAAGMLVCSALKIGYFVQ